MFLGSVEWIVALDNIDVDIDNNYEYYDSNTTIDVSNDDDQYSIIDNYYCDYAFSDDDDDDGSYDVSFVVFCLLMKRLIAVLFLLAMTLITVPISMIITYMIMTTMLMTTTTMLKPSVHLLTKLIELHLSTLGSQIDFQKVLSPSQNPDFLFILFSVTDNKTCPNIAGVHYSPNN